MRLAAVIALALLGCATGSPRAPQPVGAVRVAAPANSARAFEVVRQEWARRLGVSLDRPAPAVAWFRGPALSYPRFHGQLVSSAYFPIGDEVHVTSLAGLVHEMLHWALFQTRRDGDFHHSLPIWSHVNEVRAVLDGAGP